MIMYWYRARPYWFPDVSKDGSKHLDAYWEDASEGEADRY